MEARPKTKEQHRPLCSESIPAELRNRRAWVLWREERRNGRLTKVPYSPATGRRAKSNDPDTWGTFQEVLANRDGFDGLGIMLGNGLVGVDFDHCRDPKTGAMDKEAERRIRALDSYSEVSPSGTGVHVLCDGKLPPGGRKCGDIEMYEWRRFFTVTGNRLPSAPSQVERRTEALAALHAEVFEGDPTLKRMLNSRKGDRIQALWEGDGSGYSSHSEADLALCSHIARFAHGKAEIVDRLFRQSGLMRPKWDEAHSGDGRTYGQMTIAKALTGGGRPSGILGKVAGLLTDESTIAERLMGYLARAELVHSHDGTSFELVSGRRPMTIGLRGSQFRSWLLGLYTQDFGKPPRPTDLSSVCEVAHARGLAGAQRNVHIRVAEHAGSIYLDLGEPGTAAIEITPEGWGITEGPPVLFRTAQALGRLPRPSESATVGKLDRLQGLLNLAPKDLYLAVCWLVGALQPGRPYPVLLVTGPAGSGKSTLTRLMRSLIDPAGQDGTLTAGPPKEARDLFAAVNSTHVLAIDNLSFVPTWLSDLLSSIATGSGQMTRRLYTDSEVALVEARRPVILNGISILGLGKDLMDRAIVLSLNRPRTAETEQTLWNEAREAAPDILAGLCDAASCA